MLSIPSLRKEDYQANSCGLVPESDHWVFELKSIYIDVYSMVEIEASPTDCILSCRSGFQPRFDLQADKFYLDNSPVAIKYVTSMMVSQLSNILLDKTRGS
jgi:hypothetical protein